MAVATGAAGCGCATAMPATAVAWLVVAVFVTNGDTPPRLAIMARSDDFSDIPSGESPSRALRALWHVEGASTRAGPIRGPRSEVGSCRFARGSCDVVLAELTVGEDGAINFFFRVRDKVLRPARVAVERYAVLGLVCDASIRLDAKVHICELQ